MKLLSVGLLTEGRTDIRFLHAVLDKTLIEIAYECRGQIDTNLVDLKIEKSGLDFTEQVLRASKKGIEEFGMTLLCVQADADGKTAENVFQYKVAPAIQALAAQDHEEYCQLLVGIVPIQETEAWMLADKALLKREIGTQMSDQELNIARHPEEIARPKEVIESAIRIARTNLSKKRRKDLKIAELYLPIGQSLDLNQLEKLHSFRRFKSDLREAFTVLNLI